MKRRSFLRVLGIAPFAAPAIARAGSAVQGAAAKAAPTIELAETTLTTSVARTWVPGQAVRAGDLVDRTANGAGTVIVNFHSAMSDPRAFEDAVVKAAQEAARQGRLF